MPIFRPEESAKSTLNRALSYWPEAAKEQIVCIFPIGSRGDHLLFWRRGGRVSTGTAGGKACFEGSLLDFEDKIRRDYDERIKVAHEMGQPKAETLARHRDDYLAALTFFRTLMEEVAG